MKKLFYLGASLALQFTNNAFAFDVEGFINSNLSSNFRSEKTNIDSGCQIRNIFAGNKCVLFWTQ